MGQKIDIINNWNLSKLFGNLENGKNIQKLLLRNFVRYFPIVFETRTLITEDALPRLKMR